MLGLLALGAASIAAYMFLHHKPANLAAGAVNKTNKPATLVGVDFNSIVGSLQKGENVQTVGGGIVVAPNGKQMLFVNDTHGRLGLIEVTSLSAL